MPTKRIRLLADTRIEEVPYRCNDLVELDDKLALQAVKDGVADDHPEAVRYLAEELSVKVKQHTPREDARTDPTTKKPK